MGFFILDKIKDEMKSVIDRQFRYERMGAVWKKIKHNAHIDAEQDKEQKEENDQEYGADSALRHADC